MKKIDPTQLILLSFAGIIFLGTFLLMLPISAQGEPLSLVAALFTATSATCVTGLTVIDISIRLTLFGQIVVLLLIQIGGLGIMTFSTFFTFLVVRRLSIRGREILQQTLSQHPMKDMATLLKSVFLMTILIQAVGSLLLWWRLSQDYPIDQSAYLAIFHAVSAFCNAGFSLISTNLLDYQADYVVNITIMLLIVCGGLGFVVFFELYRYAHGLLFRQKHSFNFHTRVVLITTGWLIVAGAVLFFAFEWFNAMQTLPWRTRILSSFFQSVSSRTAGFNTLNIGALTNASLMLLIILMFIGASPASTGGGIKTSTFAVIMAMIFARFHNREDVVLNQRRISQEVVSKAIAISFFCFFLVSLFTMLLLTSEMRGLSHSQSRFSFIQILFEVVSAFGTVGLSTGITPDLSSTGQVLLVVLMYAGRLGL